MKQKTSLKEATV